MKLKGLTKLALSGVALAAVAATLGTSTYAWYISNDTATITGANGSTATMAAEGSIYAATNADKALDKWKNTIALSAANEDFVVPTAGLLPVTIANATKTQAYNTATEGNIAPAEGSFVDKKGVVKAQTDGAYMTISYWLMARGAENTQVVAVPQLKVTNTTTADSGTITYQTAYQTTNLPTLTGLDDIGEEFAIDGVLALRMSITVSEETVDEDDDTQTVLTQTHNVTNIGVAEIATSYVTPSEFATGGAANLYYNDNVNGVNLYGCAQTTGAGLSTDVAPAVTSWANVFNYGTDNTNNGKLVLTANVPTKIEYKIWLEGTDAQCYDSAAAQKFAFEFKFVKQGA